jgi:nucleotide-binding universal stress UspA family protein
MTHRSPRPPVLVGVDASAPALGAVWWAAQEALRRRAVLRLVHAFSVPTGPGVPAGRAGTDARAALRSAIEAAAGAVVEAAVAAAVEAAPGIRVDPEAVAGFAALTLMAEAGSAQLAVVGNRGLGGFPGLRVGSVALALAAHAPCPVVVVRDNPDGDGPVVVGVDGSPTSEAAVGFAFEAAAGRDVPLVGVHTWQEPGPFPPELGPPIDYDVLEAREHRVLAESLAGWCTKLPDVDLRRLVVRGPAAAVLVEQSRRAQLVVVGARGRDVFSGRLLGSVSHALIAHAACPVAVVRI